MAVLNDELYVATGSNISVFPVDGSGDVAPSRTIVSGSNTNDWLALTIFNDQVYTADLAFADVLAFPADGSGVVTPTQTITGSAGAIVGPTGLAVANNEIYVANDAGGTITVFPLGANGSSSLTRQIISGQPNANFALLANNEIFVSSESGTINVFTPSASGSAMPIRRLVGSAAAGAVGTFVVGDELYITDFTSDLMQVVPVNGTEATAPLRVLTLRGSPRGILAY